MLVFSAPVLLLGAGVYNLLTNEKPAEEYLISAIESVAIASLCPTWFMYTALKEPEKKYKPSIKIDNLPKIYTEQEYTYNEFEVVDYEELVINI